MSQPSTGLKRGIGLFQATSTNMLEMIGIGPFITIPILLAKMNGPQALLGWFLAGLLAICDGLVWAELGAAMPGAGGPYHYLKEAFGPKSLGRLMSFLFLWETTAIAPISLASGAVGLSWYVKFWWPAMGPWEGKFIAMLVCVLCMVLLYRDIRDVGRLSVVMWVVVMATVAVGGGHRPAEFPHEPRARFSARRLRPVAQVVHGPGSRLADLHLQLRRLFQRLPVRRRGEAAGEDHSLVDPLRHFRRRRWSTSS